MRLNALNLSLGARALFSVVKAIGLPTPAPQPSLSITNAISLTEGDSGATNFIYTLTLDRDGSNDPFVYSWAVAGSGTNPATADDFVDGIFPFGSGSFGPGETVKTITVQVLGDQIVEPDETFTVTITPIGLNMVSATGTIINDDTVVVNAQAATFGALTAPGATGFRPVATNNTEVMLAPGTTPTLVSGSLGSYVPQVSTGTAEQEGGRLYFTGAAGAPNGAVLRCQLASGGTVDLTINTVANAYTIGSVAEFKTNSDAMFKQPIANFTGKTFIVRARNANASYGLTNGDWTGRFAGNTSKVTIRGEKATIYPKIGTGGVFNGPGSKGNVDFYWLWWYLENTFESKITGDIQGGAQNIITTYSDAENVSITNCIVSSNSPNARLTGLRPYKYIGAAYLAGNNITFEDNKVFYCVAGVYFQDVNGLSIARNDIGYQYVDHLNGGSSVGVTSSGISIKHNVIHDWIGDNGYHCDMLQFITNNTGAVINGLKIEGNIVFPGVEGVQTPPYPVNNSGDNSKAYSRETTITVGDRALTYADHNAFITVDARTAPANITVPALSGAGTVNNKPNYLIQSYFTPTAGLAIKASPGDLIYDKNSGIGYDTIPITRPWETIVIWLTTSAPRRWMSDIASAGYQGVFIQENGGVTTNDTKVTFNLININANIVTDGPPLGTGSLIRNNSSPAVWPDPAITANYLPMGADRTIKTNKTSGAYAEGNIAGGFVGFPNSAADNVSGSELNLNNSWPSMVGAFNVPNPASQICYAKTAAEAIALARPRANGLIPSGMGCGLSSDPANDHYNFYLGNGVKLYPGEPLGRRRSTPWEVKRLKVGIRPGAADISWLPPAFLDDGAITGYDCQYRLNGAAWTAAPVSGTTASVSPIPADSLVEVRVRAGNANGWGVWTPIVSATVTEPLPGPTPTFTVLTTSPNGSIATQTDKLESASFAVSAGKSHIIAISGRMLGPSNTSPAIASATIGAVGRAFGTGTPLTPVETQSFIGRVDVECLFLATGLSGASNQTVQVTFVDNAGAPYKANGITIQVLEITGARSSGMIGAKNKVSTSNQATLSLPLTTGYDHSLVLGFAALGNGSTVSTSGFDAIITQQNPNGPTTTVSASRAVAGAGAITQSFTWGLSGAPSSAIIVEVLAAPA